MSTISQWYLRTSIAVVQLPSHVQLLTTPCCSAACQASLSLTISWSLSKFTSTGLSSGSDGKEDIYKSIQLLHDSLNCIAPYWLSSPISSQGSFINILFLSCSFAAWLGLFYSQQIESCLYCLAEPIWLNVQFGRYHRIMCVFRFSKNTLIFTIYHRSTYGKGYTGCPSLVAEHQLDRGRCFWGRGCWIGEGRRVVEDSQVMVRLGKNLNTTLESLVSMLQKSQGEKWNQIYRLKYIIPIPTPAISMLKP